MPANFNKPNPTQFGQYLEQILGPQYGVTYIERKDNRGNPIPEDSFYHISHTVGSDTIYGNFNIKLASQSNFTTTYGGRVSNQGAPIQEYAPKVVTQGKDYAFVVGGGLERVYVPPTSQGNKSITGATPGWDIQQILRGPTASLAAALDVGFGRVRDERAMGNRNVSVESSVFNILTEGSKEEATLSVPAGTTMVRQGSTVAPSIEQNASKMIQIQNVYDKNAGVSTMEQARRMNERTYNAIQSNEPIPTQAPPYPPPSPGLTPQELATYNINKANYYTDWQKNPATTFSTNLKFYGYAQDRSIGMGESESNRLREYFHYGAEGFLPTSKIVKHLNLIETREQATLLGQDLKPIQATPIPARGDVSGYHLTTAQVGGRIPKQTMIMHKLYTAQAMEPGAGEVFPENWGVDIRTAGFEKSPRRILGENVSDLVQGNLGIELPHKEGEEILSGQKWTYARISTGKKLNAQGQLEPLPSIDLEEKMGAHTMVMGQQRLVIPEWYDKTTGFGAGYDEKLIALGALRRVTAQDVSTISSRVNAPVVTNPTVDKIYLEMAKSQLEINAKFAGAGMKVGQVELPGKPMVNAGGKTGIPIGMMTWDIKALPEDIITSLGAMNAGKQEKLLGEYATSLRLSEKATNISQAQSDIYGHQADMVRLAIGETRKARKTNPDFRLDIDRLASTMNMPAHEVGRDILERIILSGVDTKPGQTRIQAFSQMSEEGLKALAETPANLRNLNVYGTGLVSSTSPVTIPYSEEEVGTLIQAYKTAAMSEESAIQMGFKGALDEPHAEKEFYKKYGFEQVAHGGMINRTFRAPGLMVTGLVEPVLEWSGGGELNAEGAEKFGEVAPEYANRLGMGITDLTSGGALARSLEPVRGTAESIPNPARWGAAQMAALTMMETSRAGFEVPKATVITPEIAQNMMADPEMTGALGRQGSNLAGLTKFEELLQRYYPDIEPDKLKTRPIRFGGTDTYVPSPFAFRTQAVEDAATMQETNETGEDITRTWNMGQRAIRAGIEGTVMQDPGFVKKGVGRLYSYLEERFGLADNTKRKGNQQLFGTDVAATNARYSYMSGLKQNEVYAPDEFLKAQIRHGMASKGIEITPQETEQVLRLMQGKDTKIRVPRAEKEYIREMGTPIGIARYPITGGEEATAFAHLVTGEQLKRRGQQVPISSGLSNQVWRIGVGLSTIFQGDFDWDMLAGILGINKASRSSKGLNMAFGVFNSKGILDPKIAERLNYFSKVPYREIMEKVFPAGMSKEFDPLFQRVLETGQGGMAAVAKLVGTQYDRAGQYPYEMLRQSLEMYAGAKQQMGGIYNFTRAMEASQAATGWTNEQIMTGQRTRAQLYQPFLDITAQRATPMAQMYQTSFLSEGAGGYLGLSWGQTPDQGGEMQWQEKGSQYNRLDNPSIIKTLKNMVYSAIQPTTRGGNQELPTPEAIATYFSPEGGRAYNVNAEGKITNERNPLDVDLANKIAQLRKAGTPDPELEKQYYQAASLQEAVSGPYFQKGLTTEQRMQAMRTSTMNWYEQNYGETVEGRQKLFNVPMLTGMFGKALASKLQKEPGWEPPISFAPTVEGQQLTQTAALQQPLYNMMRGRLFGGDTAMRFMRGVQNIANPSNILNWGLGNIQNILGFGRMKMSSEMGTLYEQAMGEPVELHASTVPKILGVGAKFKTNTTLGPQGTALFQEQALRETGAYTAARLLGFESNSKTYDLTNTLFPSDENERLQAGTVMEAKLGAIMGEQRGWKSNNPMRWNEDIGLLENVELSDASKPYRSSFTWTGNLGGVNTRVSATPDFPELIEKPGEEPMLKFHELKTVGATVTDEEIRKRMPGFRMQAKITPWVIEQNRRQIEAGGTGAAQAEKNLLNPLATYFPNREERLKAERAIELGRMQSEVNVVRSGSPLAQEIEKGTEANPDIIQAEFAKQAAPGYWGTKTTQQATYQYNPVEQEELTGKLVQAAQMSEQARPRVFSKLWDIAANAPRYWTQRRNELIAQGQPSAGATAALDTSRQIFDQMRNIGQGAQADILSQMPVMPMPQAAGGGGQPSIQPPVAVAAPAASQPGRPTQIPLSQQATTPITPPGGVLLGATGTGGVMFTGAQGPVQSAQPGTTLASQPAGGVAPNTILPIGKGWVDPTARAERFEQQYEQNYKTIMGGGDQLKTALGLPATATGFEVNKALSKLSTPEINQKLGFLAPVGKMAHELYGEAQAVSRAVTGGKVLLSNVSANILSKTSDVIDVEGGTGLGQHAAAVIAASKVFEVGKQGAAKAGVDPSTLNDYMARLGTSFKNATEAFDELHKTAKPTKDTIKQFQITTAQLNKDLSEWDVHKAAAPLVAAGVLGKTPGAVGRYEQIGAPQGQAQVEQLSKFMKEQGQFEGGGGTGGGRRGGGLFGAGEGGANYQQLARRMLGGFGLMYLRSVGGIMLSGTEMGYKESLQEQQQIEAGYGGRFGGAIPMANPEQQLQRATAIYGGTGYSAIKQAYAKGIQTQPSLAGAVGAGAAGVGLAGLLGTLAMWTGTTVAAPALGAIVAGGMAVSGGINTWAAATQPEKNAVSIASQLATGGIQRPGDTNIKQVFNWSNYGYRLNAGSSNPDQVQMVNILDKMRKYSGTDLIGYLKSQGITAPQQISQYMTMFGQVQAAQYPNIPIEGLIGARNLQQQYGVNLQPGAYGSFAQFASGLAQGVPYEQTALSLAWTPSTTFTQQQVAAGQLMTSWAQGQGLTQAQIQGAQVSQQRYQQLGMFAPSLTGNVPVSSSQWQATNYNIAQQMLGWKGTGYAPPTTAAPSKNIGGKIVDWLTSGQTGGNIFTGIQTVPASAYVTSQMNVPAITSNAAQERTEALRRLEGPALAALTPGSKQEQYQKQLHELTEQQFQLYKGAYGSYTNQLMLGGKPTEPMIGQYQGITGNATIAQQMNEQQMKNVRENMQLSIQASYQQLGYNPNITNITQGMNNAQLGWEQQRMAGVANYQPWALTQTYAAGMNLPNGQAVSPWMVSRDVWSKNAGVPSFLQGKALNAPAFTVQGLTSGMGGMLSANMGKFNWGGAVGQAFNNGYTIPGTNITAGGGITDVQNMLMYSQAQGQMAQAGIQSQRIALAMKYTPMMWNVQDQMRDLGIQQSQWGFQQQRAGMTMQAQQMGQNWGLQQQQTQMQRGWTQQDWAFQNQQRNQQWGWQVSDFQENLRFMTGRDRRLAERQMGRQTIVHDQEGEQIDKNQQRQKELWALEDERFDLQKQQFAENQKFQEDAISKQEEFFNERTTMEKALEDLQREYQKEQWKLDQASAGIQAKQAKDALDYAELQAGINVTMLQQSTYMDDISKNGYLFAALMDTKLREWITLLGGTPYTGDDGGGGGGGGGSGGGGGDYQRALGGRVAPGERYLVGERGPEPFIPDMAGTVLPWHTLNIDRQPTTSKSRQPQIIVVNIGNEEFKRYIVDTVEDEV